MPRNFLPAIVSAGLTLGGGALPAAAASILDIRALYGDRIEFGVYRGGAEIGEHIVQFDEVDDGLRVQTSTNLAVSALFITVYRFEYESDALWQDGTLMSITARTNDGGTVSEIEAEAEGGSLTVTGPNGTDEAPVGIYPTNHWNAGVIGSTRVLDTFTGRISDVDLASKGREQVVTAHGTLDATRYQYSGAIDNEVWYDAEGRWVQMQFKGTDGSTIQLRCRSCKAVELADAVR
ncbi:hypothetical protein BN1012_Phect666 [Candidatus Phaeomarinobacter ectocarpi]|uniref:Uncharacterized protein n=1 Tax=Candidatus Phaeomarinibacter ectocarpi TaxID=1458461 RepID=X5MKT8_9HYPH|nr:DUF6134 family protein [Candidatus Phaeomarinobacter ectocarpi]CDO58880.1 hypothetical protein BN1012_Phect666 [Candidatus Phaeomarinobacter ectocarpi]